MTTQHTPTPWQAESIDNEGDYGDGGPDCSSGFKSFCARATKRPASMTPLETTLYEALIAVGEDVRKRQYKMTKGVRLQAAGACNAYLILNGQEPHIIKNDERPND